MAATTTTHGLHGTPADAVFNEWDEWDARRRAAQVYMGEATAPVAAARRTGSARAPRARRTKAARPAAASGDAPPPEPPAHRQFGSRPRPPRTLLDDSDERPTAQERHEESRAREPSLDFYRPAALSLQPWKPGRDFDEGVDAAARCRGREQTEPRAPRYWEPCCEEPDAACTRKKNGETSPCWNARERIARERGRHGGMFALHAAMAEVRETHLRREMGDYTRFWAPRYPGRNSERSVIWRLRDAEDCTDEDESRRSPWYAEFKSTTPLRLLPPRLLHESTRRSRAKPPKPQHGRYGEEIGARELPPSKGTPALWEAVRKEIERLAPSSGARLRRCDRHGGQRRYGCGSG